MTNGTDNLLSKSALNSIQFQSMTIDCAEAPPPTTATATSNLTPSTTSEPSRADSNEDVEAVKEEEEEFRALLPVSHTNHNQSVEDR